MNRKDLDNIDRTIRLIEIALVLGKNLVLIISIFVGITIALAVYNLAIGNTAWGIFNSAFGFGGLVFLSQIRQTRRQHYRRKAQYRMSREHKYPEAEAA